MSQVDNGFFQQCCSLKGSQGARKESRQPCMSRTFRQTSACRPMKEKNNTKGVFKVSYQTNWSSVSNPVTVKWEDMCHECSTEPCHRKLDIRMTKQICNISSSGKRLVSKKQELHRTYVNHNMKLVTWLCASLIMMFLNEGRKLYLWCNQKQLETVIVVVLFCIS